MNPWEVLLVMFGWILVGLLALIVVTFVVAFIVATVKALRPRRHVQKGLSIMSSRRDEEGAVR